VRSLHVWEDRICRCIILLAEVTEAQSWRADAAVDCEVHLVMGQYFRYLILPVWTNSCLQPIERARNCSLSKPKPFSRLAYSLTVVARPAAASSGAPTIAREAHRADSRNPSRKRGKLTSCASAPYHLQFNDISISLI